MDVFSIQPSSSNKTCVRRTHTSKLKQSKWSRARSTISTPTTARYTLYALMRIKHFYSMDDLCACVCVRWAERPKADHIVNTIVRVQPNGWQILTVNIQLQCGLFDAVLEHFIYGPAVEHFSIIVTGWCEAQDRYAYIAVLGRLGYVRIHNVGINGKFICPWNEM